jgi:tRNA-specific 2-thiouridylase
LRVPRRYARLTPTGRREGDTVCSEPAAQPKAVLLFSGGLDSILAAEWLVRAGVDLILLRCQSVFFPLRHAGHVPRCPTVARDVSNEMVELVCRPRYGHGKNLNPCLDCRQMMYGLAWQEALRQGAGFIVTGEVLGQRPMSQRLDAFNRMEKGAGVRRLVVRPLSGKVLPPTLPEESGAIRREAMLSIQGRSRKPQMALAREWGIRQYPSPAGGCKLTDPQFADRVSRLQAMGLLTPAHVRSVRNGRMFQLGRATYCLVGRNEHDNATLVADRPSGSLILRLRHLPGPVACVVGPASADALEEARRLVLRYSRFPHLPTAQVCADSGE